MILNCYEIEHTKAVTTFVKELSRMIPLFLDIIDIML